jgi:hypothetical protein
VALVTPGPRPDAPTGGRLVIKKGAARDTEYRTRQQSRREEHRKYEPSASTRAPAPKRRKCRFCGRPMLFVAAPLVLVIVFALRVQRSSQTNALGSVSGYAVLLDAARSEEGLVAAVGIRPGGKLAAMLLRARPEPAGSPVQVVFSTDSPAQRPILLYGETPGGELAQTVLRADLASDSRPTVVVRAEVSIGGKTVTLARTLQVQPDSPPK